MSVETLPPQEELVEGAALPFPGAGLSETSAATSSQSDEQFGNGWEEKDLDTIAGELAAARKQQLETMTATERAAFERAEATLARTQDAAVNAMFLRGVGRVMYQLRTGIARDRAHKVADPVWEQAIQVYAGQAMADEQHAHDDWRRFSKDDKAA